MHLRKFFSVLPSPSAAMGFALSRGGALALLRPLRGGALAPRRLLALSRFARLRSRAHRRASCRSAAVLKAINKMIVMGGADDSADLKAGAFTHHKAIGSVDAKGVTSLAD